MKNVLLIGDKNAPSDFLFADIERCERYKIQFVCGFKRPYKSAQTISFQRAIQMIKKNNFAGDIIIASLMREEIVNKLRQEGISLNIYAVSQAYFERMPWLKKISMKTVLYSSIDTATYLLYKDGKYINPRFMLGLLMSMPNFIREMQKKRQSDKAKEQYKYTYKGDIDIVPINDIRKPELTYYEMQLTDHCNLKCKCCTHYSNVAPVGYADLKQYRKDIGRLGELFWNVRQIRLLGGEPLLNPLLSEFIRETRKQFPFSEISVVTNGVLIPKAASEIFEAMKDCGVFFDITMYPPTSKMISIISKVCEERGVQFTTSMLIKNFYGKWDPTGRNDAFYSFKYCEDKGCHLLLDGKISMCHMPIIYQKHFNLIKEGPNHQTDYNPSADIIDIWDDSLDGYKLIKLLSSPINSCRYCDIKHRQIYEWEGNYREIVERQ